MAPSSLFKFFNKSATNNQATYESIFRGRVKFTPIAELNDPAEFNPILNREVVEASLEHLRSKGHSEADLLELNRQGAMFRALAPDHMAVPIPESREKADALIRSAFYDQTAILERRLISMAKEIASRVGVFCLSKSFKSLPMWAHYADNADGFVVEYNDLGKSFKGDETGVLMQLGDVIYENEIKGVTFDPSSYRSLFFSKNGDWDYEREVRIVLPLSKCGVLESGSGKFYFFDLPCACVRRVILGWNMPEAVVEAIKDAVAAANPCATVVHAQFHRGEVRIAGEKLY
ncbi:DUF2971 domain-containing protein [Castellaniella caeni]|uniref:DUF2971 domain-containing protein n=1 Tax=Castellaniella caeni TaxID=266123 RepID=UPI000A0406B1|nr:DUF2971 domain-containing protein [Castellaniella caeni]